MTSASFANRFGKNLAICRESSCMKQYTYASRFGVTFRVRRSPLRKGPASTRRSRRLRLRRVAAGRGRDDNTGGRRRDADFAERKVALAKVDENMLLPHILDIGYLPTLLRDHPTAVVPYLVSRDGFIARLYHQRTGYWQPDGQGLDPRSQEERAAALDLLAGEKAEAFVTAAATLAGQGDLALALEIITPGLLRHPGSSELAELREAVLVRLMEQRQLLDPFGFLVTRN